MNIREVQYMTADWCAPCKRTWPWVKKAAEAQGHKVRKVDIDKEPVPDWLLGVPTVIVVFEDGQQAVLNPSVLNRESLANALKLGDRRG